MQSITVATGDLRQALNSVRVHACADKEVPPTHRIRLAIGAENVTVIATDHYTAALAIVSIWVSDPEFHDPITVDLLPDDVAKLLAIHGGGKEKRDEPQLMLRLEITADRITVTDCSGLIDGRALTIPRLPTDGGTLCAIPDLVLKQHASPITEVSDMPVSGDSAARFKAAAAAYGEGLELEAHAGSRALLVRCGESFLGLMMPRTIDDEERARLAEYAAGWTRRLPEIAAAGRAERADIQTVKVGQVAVVDLDEDVDRSAYLHAVDLVVRSQFASASMLQRRMRIGLAKALGLLEQMETAGIVGPRPEGSRTRTVHVPADAVDELLAAIRGATDAEPGSP